MDEAVDRLLTRLFWDGVPAEPNSLVYRSLVPKDIVGNIQFRKAMSEAGYADRSVARELRSLCSRDALFFFNTFVSILETRRAADWQVCDRMGGAKTLPFITREYQDDAILRIIPQLGRRDICIPKSRETGVTWIFCGLADWEWLFHPDTHIGFVSKDEASVGDFDDPDSLFSKLEFILDRLPVWLKPKPNDMTRNVNNISLVHESIGSTLMGYAATGDVMRGGRKSWMLLDEFHFFKVGADVQAMESTQHATRSRAFVSTFNRHRGQSGAFYDQVQREDDGLEMIVIDWKQDVDKARGLYTSERIGDSDGFTLKILDTEFWNKFHTTGDLYRHPTDSKADYPFIRDGKTRSLYYDFEWKRGTPEAIASELDRDPAGATSQFCDRTVLRKAELKACDPYHVMDISRDTEAEDRPFVIHRELRGLLGLWCELDAELHPPRDVYSLGADISAGTGGAFSSYSHIAIFSKTSGQQVAEWRSNRMGITDFADLCCFLCRMFYNAHMVPECNGPLGSIFTARVIENRYPALFRRRTLGERRSQHGANEPGYRNRDKGLELLNNLIQGMRVGACQVKSKLALRELGRYVLKGGELTHTSLKDETDGAAQGKAHADAAIGTAASWFGVTDWPAPKPDEKPGVVPEGCALWRRQQWEQKQRKSGNKSWWSPNYV